MAASAKRKHISDPRGDLNALRLRRDLRPQDVESAAATATKFFENLAEHSAPPPSPDPSKFDPMAEAHWELGMMLVSKIGGTVDQIRQVWSKYRRATWEIVYDDDGLCTGQRRQGRPVSQLDLAIMTSVWTRDGTNLLPLQEAKQNIRNEAESGELVGYGEPLDAPGAPIPFFEWRLLEFHNDNSGLILRFERGSRGYRNVFSQNHLAR